MLWQQVLGVARSWLGAPDTAPLGPACVAAAGVLDARRLAGKPRAYLVRQRGFVGRAFRVTPDVLIPRPETECLVDVALDILADRPAPRVLDLGTGSGIVAISIALARPDAQVTATDLSAAALEVAEQNAQALGASLQFLHGNWYDSLLGSSRYDLIVSNPPYIHVQDRHLGLGDLRFEPPMALT